MSGVDAQVVTLGELRQRFIADPDGTGDELFGTTLATTAIVKSAGESMYGTPAVQVSEVRDGAVAAVFVLPYGRKSAASFQRLRRLRPGDNVRLTGRCYLFSEADGPLVFKDSTVELI